MLPTNIQETIKFQALREIEISFTVKEKKNGIMLIIQIARPTIELDVTEY